MARPWQDLPLDLAIKVAGYIIDHDDFKTYGKICKDWRSARKKAKYRGKSKTLWLMMCGTLKYNSETRGWVYNHRRRFYSLSKTTDLDCRFSYSGESRRYFSSLDWLISCTKELKLSLIHPFSGVERTLPSLSVEVLKDEEYGESSDVVYLNHIVKFVLSDSPFETCDFTLLMLTWGGNRNMPSGLSYWKPGCKIWTPIPINIAEGFSDVIFYKQEFYAVDFGGNVLACGNLNYHHNNHGDSCQPPPEHRPHFVGKKLAEDYHGPRKLYLVESTRGKLLLVDRQGFKNRRDIGTRRFQTYEVQGADRINIGDGTGAKLVSVGDLGDQTLFLGLNSSSSISIDASTRGIEPNSIYFTDDWMRFDGSELLVYDEFLSDMGSFQSTAYERLVNRIHPRMSSVRGDMGIYDVRSRVVRPFPRVGMDKIASSHAAPPLWIQLNV